MSITIEEPQWKYVELGRVIFIAQGPAAGKIATIVEIVDQKRVLVDGPSVDRQAVSLSHTTLTDFVIEGLSLAAPTEEVAKLWASADIDSKWAASALAKKLAQQEKRAQLTDFERFQVSLLKKQKKAAIYKAVQA
ncbi:60S ribosomal protein eL14 [Magnusiomyces paraingens]|uniref:Large ribosomal subunit protein eL14 domain-containing protein n=1 Tax=Magnusiomyces paraingens TaxID=2606893 RepID=A0A5E8C2I6_9ASCO|nr:uncharacterized protein SAPINGB_P004550 [Saprochaete ingens]VVT55345.1 unnamed protein product [Saprochaete ingens]